MTAARRRPSSVDALRRGMAAPAAGSEKAVADPQQVFSAPEHRPRPSKPERTRYTLDLDPDQHQFLTGYAQRIEAKASEVMRTLLRQLEADPGLADRVRDSIWQAD